MSTTQILSPLPHSSSQRDWPRLTRGQRWRLPVLCILLLLGFAGNVVLSHLTPSPDASQVSFVTCWLLTYLPYLVASVLVLATHAPGGRRQRAELLLLLAGAFVLRVPLLFNAPNLSHDSWRYVWDARVFLHGYSPYVYAPGDTLLAHMRDFIFANSRFRNVPSIYPPAAQYVYILSYLIVPSSLYFLKFVFLVFDMVSCFVLTRLLARKGLDPTRALLYAWCPLPIVEFALEGHVDVITITFSLLAVLAAQNLTKRGRVLTGFLIGMATLTKFYPILLLAPVVRLREWKRDWLLVLSCLLTIVVGYVPFFIQGHGQIFGFLSIYTNEQGLNAGVIQLLLGQLGGHLHLALASIITLEHLVAFVLVCGISLVIFLLRQNNRVSLETGVLVLFGLVLAVSSHVFPWYVPTLLPWVVLLLPARGKLLAGLLPVARLLALASVWLFVCVISGGYIENWPTYYLLIYDPLIAGLFLAAVVALYVVFRVPGRKVSLMSSDQLTLEQVIPPPPPQQSRVKVWFVSLVAGLIAGFVASLVSAVCMLALRLGAGVPTPAELFGDFALKRLSTRSFIALLMRFAPNPKTEPLGLALLAMIGLGTLLGILYVLLVRLHPPVNGRRPARREWLVMLGFGLVMSIVGSALFWVELRQNFLGLSVDWSRLVSALALLLDFMIYAIVLGWCYRAILPQVARVGETRTAQSRRALLARTGVAVLGIGSAAGSLGMVRGFLNDYASYDGMKYYPPGDITPPITPNDEHYVVTQNPVDPTPSLNVWRLDVTGLVGASGTYTYEEFTSLPSVSRAITLECIANGLGDHLISTAIWQGVTLRSLLEKHGGAQSTARYVAFYSVDGYTVSQPLDEVLAVDTLIAFRMNGAELPMRHGYPVRVLIPGRYGEENPKWLTRIELADHFVGGLYSDQGWYNGPLHTITRIDRPRGDAAFAPLIEVSGLAFAGNRGIQRVEISTDGGTGWSDAQLAPPLSQDSWVLWTYQWHPAARGHYTLVARSTDGTGQVQTSQKQITVPNGATGYHIVGVTLH